MSASDRRTVTLQVNGVRRRLRVAPMARLLDVLREDCGLTGTKEGCGEGECGACTVLLDGAAVDACLVPVAHAHGATITTIEGAGAHPAGTRLQACFETHGAAQCGICTPGMIMAAMTVTVGTPAEDVPAALAGNLCRCTGYSSIFRAVAEATTRRRPASSRTRRRGRRT